ITFQRQEALQEASSRRLIYFRNRKKFTRVISCYAWATVNNGSFITVFVESVNESVQLATECSPPFY
ncbi:unnamed protein product, partial [Pocillopora meandrina]